VYSHALGYLGGLSWAVLVAWVCTRAPREATRSDVALLAHFFETFSRWPWPQPVTLTSETARYRPDGRRDLLPVIAPALPPRNTARNVSRSTFQVLRDELVRAHDVMTRARGAGTAQAWEALFEQVDLARETQARLVLTVGAPTFEARDIAAGWVLGHLTALLYGLEGDRQLFARPALTPGAEGTFVIGLSTRAPQGVPALFARTDSPLARTLEDFRASFRDWSHRPEGTTLRAEVRPHG
jgi:poly(A) polymerase